MKETEALVRLQEIDLELIQASRKLRAMPQARRIEASRLARKKLAGQLSQIVGQRKDCEMEVADVEAHHARLEGTAEDVRRRCASGEASYRDARDLETQLSALAKGMEKLEYQHGQLVERLDKLRRAESNARALDERLVGESQALADSLREDTADIRARADALRQERAHCLRNISPEVAEHYERASRHFGGLAVETLRGNLPSVCHVRLQPAVFSDIRRGPAITECPYCHRMLVTEGALDDAR